jgi:hypothetical protein
MKRAALRRHRHYEIDFSRAELALLSDEKYYLDGEEPKTDDNSYPKFVPNFRFAFRQFAKSSAIQFSLKVGESQLPDFEKLRNRLTHPKKLEDLTVTDREVELVMRTWKWFNVEFARLMSLVETRPHQIVRKPDTRGIKPWPPAKPFLVLLTDGRVYHFDTLEEAEDHKTANAGPDCVQPVVVDLSDPEGKPEPER